MQRVTVACVGDSLTAGNCIAKKSYPQELQKLLTQRQPDRTWDVKNLGVQGSSVKEWLLSLGGSTDYKRCCAIPGPEVTGALAAGCDVIIVMLGTNGAQKNFWNEQEFTSSLTQLVKKLQSDYSPTSLLLATPPPILPSGSFAKGFEADVINAVLPRIIPQIAASLGLVCIDSFSAVTPNGIGPDGVHLGNEGFKMVASAMIDPVLQSIQSSPVERSTKDSPVERSTKDSPAEEAEFEEEEVEVEEEEEEELCQACQFFQMYDSIPQLLRAIRKS
jgi:lysophospholipase L1-like esterase